MWCPNGVHMAIMWGSCGLQDIIGDVLRDLVKFSHSPLGIFHVFKILQMRPNRATYHIEKSFTCQLKLVVVSSGK